MKNPTKVLLAAAVVLAGSAAVAAALPTFHELTFHLPNGGVEKISYTGDIAPKVTILPDIVQVGAPMPSGGFWTPIANFDRISAQMDAMADAVDHQMAIAMQGMDAMSLAEPNGLVSATLRNLPAGTESYSMVSTMSGSNACTREVQIISRGDGAQPKVVSHSFGNCGAANSPSSVTSFGDSHANGRLMKVKAYPAVQPTTGGQHI